MMEITEVKSENSPEELALLMEELREIKKESRLLKAEIRKKNEEKPVLTELEKEVAEIYGDHFSTKTLKRALQRAEISQREYFFIKRAKPSPNAVLPQLRNKRIPTIPNVVKVSYEAPKEMPQEVKVAIDKIAERMAVLRRK